MRFRSFLFGEETPDAGSWPHSYVCVCISWLCQRSCSDASDTALLTIALWWFQARLLTPEEIGAIGLQPANRHPVLAGFFDLHLFGSAFPALLVVSITLVPRIEMLLFVVGIGLCGLFYEFIYLRFSSNHSNVCTLGERMAGCSSEHGSKEWYSLFTQSRWLLFLTCFVLLLYPGNAFDSIIERAIHGHPPSLLLVIGRSVYVAAFLVSIYNITQGKFGWSIIPYIFLSVQIIFSIDLTGLLLVHIVKWMNLFSISLLTIMLAYI